MYLNNRCQADKSVCRSAAVQHLCCCATFCCSSKQCDRHHFGIPSSVLPLVALPTSGWELHGAGDRGGCRGRHRAADVPPPEAVGEGRAPVVVRHRQHPWRRGRHLPLQQQGKGKYCCMKNKCSPWHFSRRCSVVPPCCFCCCLHQTPTPSINRPLLLLLYQRIFERKVYDMISVSGTRCLAPDTTSYPTFRTSILVAVLAIPESEREMIQSAVAAVAAYIYAHARRRMSHEPIQTKHEYTIRGRSTSMYVVNDSRYEYYIVLACMVVRRS